MKININSIVYAWKFILSLCLPSNISFIFSVIDCCLELNVSTILYPKPLLSTFMLGVLRDVTNFSAKSLRINLLYG